MAKCLPIMHTTQGSAPSLRKETLYSNVDKQRIFQIKENQGENRGMNLKKI